MMHCPSCRSEDDRGYTHCLECGTLLDNGPVPPLEASRELSDAPPYVVIGSWLYPADAHVARMQLENEGIACNLLDENFVYADWLNAMAVGGIKLAVAPEDEARARAVLVRSSPMNENDTVPGATLSLDEAISPAHALPEGAPALTRSTPLYVPRTTSISLMVFQGFLVVGVLTLLAYGLKDLVTSSPPTYAQQLRAVDRKRFGVFQSTGNQDPTPTSNASYDTH